MVVRYSDGAGIDPGSNGPVADTTQLTARATTQSEHDVEGRRDEGRCEPSQGPETWTAGQKWRTVSTVCLVCFAVGLNATGVLAASTEISEEFDVDLEGFDYSVFMITAWNLGAAVVPLLILPLMEDLGIRPIYYGAYCLFFVFVVVQAVAPNFATLIVSRTIAGSCGGVLQNCVDGIAADVWGPDIHSRALSLTLYICALLGGVTVGPAIGGVISKSLGWRWILYVQLIIHAAIIPCVVLTLRDPRPRLKHERRKSKQEMLTDALDETVFRAVRMLFTEFVVGSFTLLSSFAFGTVLIMTQSIPLVFSNVYGWSDWQTGLVQVAIFIGEVVGAGLCVIQDKVVYPRYACRGKGTSSPVPEPRLYTAIPCSILGLTTGFFIYGWTADSSILWLAPAFGLFLIGIGIMAVIQAISTYVTDCYALHASSAISGVAFGENVFAAFLPLATRDMYMRLGFAWASSLLGFAGFVLSMAPVVLVLAGPRIRAQSKYSQ